MSYDDTRKSFNDRNHNTKDDTKQPFDDTQKSFSDSKRDIDDSKRSITDPERSYSAPQRSYNDNPRRHNDNPRRHDDSQRPYNDSPRPFNDAPRAFKKMSKEDLLEDLLDLDQHLMKLLSRRTTKIAKLAGKNKPLDAALEKNIWKNFEEAGQNNRISPIFLRTFFAQLASLPEHTVEKRSQQNYQLVSKREPLQLKYQAPPDSDIIRMYLILSAMTKSSVAIAPYILCDAVAELIKSLNHIGSAFFWQDTLIEQDAEKIVDFSFEEKVIYVGDDPFNLYLLLAFALYDGGNCRFTGGGTLKDLNLRPLNKILPQFGARIATMNPRTTGLPIRLEASGMFEKEITIDENCPPQFVAALILTSSHYNKEASFILPENANYIRKIEKALMVLKACGVPVQINENILTFSQEELVVPEKAEVPLDAILSAYLLVMPLFSDGFVQLEGVFPKELSLAENIFDHIQELGVVLERTETTITARKGQFTANSLDWTKCPALFPLALAASFAYKRTCSLTLPDNEQYVTDIESLLENLHVPFQIENDQLLVHDFTTKWEGAFSSPSTFITLGVALISMTGVYMSIANPGVILSMWPQYWNIYNSLPYAPKKHEKEVVEHVTKRRIIVGS